MTPTLTVPLVSPLDGGPLHEADGAFRDAAGHRFPIVNGIPRFVTSSGYATSFGLQWNRFARTQLDAPGVFAMSRARFFAGTGWTPDDLAGRDVLEVGSGAGRFSRVVLRDTSARLYSVDLSEAVDANLANNGPHERLHLFQASVLALPFPPRAFARVFCFGVLQHTPDPERSVRGLADMVRPGGGLAVDFYPRHGWWTRVHGKYLVRPATRRMPAARLLRLIDRNVDWMLRVSALVRHAGLERLVGRFIPVADPRPILPVATPAAFAREWAVLDTFDMLSPAYDRPLRVADVARWFEAGGLRVTHAGPVAYWPGLEATVVRGVRA